MSPEDYFAYLDDLDKELDRLTLLIEQGNKDVIPILEQKMKEYERVLNRMFVEFNIKQ